MSIPSIDPASRKKIAILAVIGAVFVIYVGNTFLVKPMAATKKKIATGQVKLEEDILKAEQRIKQIEETRRKAADQIVSLARDVLHVNHALVPRLDNYDVIAQEAVERWSGEAGVSNPDVTRSRVVAITQGFKRKKTTAAFKGYRAPVSATCSLADCVKLLETIEADNPYVTIGGVAITGRPTDAERHNVRFSLRWPVWSGETMHADLQTRLKHYLNVKEGS